MANKTTNKDTQLFKILELFLLFVVTPILLTLAISTYLKLLYLGLGLLYIVWVSVKKERFVKVNIESKTLKKTVFNITIRFVFIAIGTIIFLYMDDKNSLFNVMLYKTDLWLKFSLVYILFSVIPQELIYRSFFVKRYQKIFKNELLFVLTNAILFSFAHIWFQSWVVLGFTFVGGILFIKTYLKTKFLWLVLLEHSLYGVWLYTVGYGKLFMFPV